MSVCKENVLLEGTLRGEGRQRTCRVKAIRSSEFPDEAVAPTAITYCRCDIDDSDDFPDGDYELEFDGRKLLLRKSGGQYMAQ